MPSTNFRTIDKAFATGWGGVVAKTISLDSTPVMNVTPRYGKLKTSNGDVIGFENIELISDRSLDVWLDVFKRIKDKHPDKILIASLMESYEKENESIIYEIALTLFRVTHFSMTAFLVVYITS